MVLSDRDIKKVIKDGRLVFKPKISDDQIGPASIDLKLSPIFRVFHTERHAFLDIKKSLPKELTISYKIKDDQYFMLHPNNFVLASTMEYIKVPDDLICKIEGKSSLARIGILVHTAGFIDPGFEGTLTLEISNQSNLAVTLYPRMYICQIAIERLSSPAETPYYKRKKSLYLKQKGPTNIKLKNLF